MIEIEIKIPVDNRSELEGKIQNHDFVQGELTRESDTYFNSDYYDLRKMDKAVRVRSCEKLQNGERKAFITYKGSKMDSVSMTRKELETEIQDPVICMEILKSLGYYIIYEVKKIRQYYHKEEVTLCLDQVEGLVDFLEAEILAENEKDKEQTLEQLYEILGELGLKKEDTIQTSYLAMLCNR